MLRCTIELMPRGIEDLKRTIGLIEIANKGTGTNQTGNYQVILKKTFPWKGALIDTWRKAMTWLAVSGDLLLGAGKCVMIIWASGLINQSKSRLKVIDVLCVLMVNDIDVGLLRFAEGFDKGRCHVD